MTFSITVTFSISAAQFENDAEDDYNWDEEDEGPSDDDGGLLNQERDLPTIDSKSGRVMSKPRKAGSPLEWLLGAKMSGYTAGGNETMGKKGKKGPKKYEQEPEEDEYPETEEFEEELTEEGEWDEEAGGARYAPINTKITISKVPFIVLEVIADCRAVMPGL